LDYSAFGQISAEIVRQGQAARIAAYLHVIARANPATLQEAIKMGEALTIEKVFEEVGWIAKWEEHKALGIAQNMIKMGFPIETVISVTQLDPEKVKMLYQNN